MLTLQYRQVSKMFSEKQTDRLIELIQQNEDQLFPSHFNKPNRSTSRQTWATIAQIFNAEFPNDTKTPEQIRVKWKNMRQKAREANQLHLLTRPLFPRRQNSDNSKFCSSTASRSNETGEMNSLANVLGIFSDSMIDDRHNNTVDRSAFKTERESSVLSLSSEPNSESTPSERMTNPQVFRRAPPEPSRPNELLPIQNVDDNVQTPLITTGPPLNFEQTIGSRKRQLQANEDPQPLWSTMLKRRNVVDEVDQLKHDLLVEEIQNAKKVGILLDETLTFLKRLNEYCGISEKLNGLISSR